MKFLNKIYVSPFCLVFLLIVIIFNKLEETIFLFSICFIHELGHIIVAKFFLCKIKQVTMNIFGFCAEIDGIEYLSFKKQIIIYLAGPLTFFVSWLILDIFNKNDIINLYEYRVYMDNNIAMCLFNLIPLYPLDGGRILDAINKKFFHVKECLINRKIWTIICLFIISIVLIRENQLILLIVLSSFVIINLLSSKYEYINYLEDRLMRNIEFETKISFDNEIFHFNNNYYFEGEKLINEKKQIPIMILKENVRENRKNKNRKYL